MKQHPKKEKKPKKLSKAALAKLEAALAEQKKAVAEHLKEFQFKKGESGNIEGRPRGIKREIENAANDKLEFWFEWLFVRKERDLERLMSLVGQDEVLSAADRVMLTEVNRGHILNMLDRVAPRLMAMEKIDEKKKKGIEDLIDELET